MKFLLLQSPDDLNSPGNVKSLPPISLGVLVGYLRKNNFYVKAYDLNENISRNYSKTPYERWLELYDKNFFLDCLTNPDQIEKISELYKYLLEGINIDEYDIIGISTGTYASFFEIHFSFLIGKLIQTKYNKPVILGGIGVAHFFSSDLFKNDVLELVLKNFKYIIVGPGEKSLVRLLQSFETKSIDEVYSTLKGAVFLSNGEVIVNEIDKPTFTCPDYSDFNLDYYKLYFAENDADTIVKQLYGVYFPFNIEISNFIKKNSPDSNYSVNLIPYFFNHYCAFNCTFCAQSGNTSKPITKDVKEIIDDISFLQEQHNFKYFQFLNNVFNFSPSFVREFCSMIIDNGIEIYWSDCARVNSLTKELLELMYRAGCRRLIFGFETGSEKMLNYINKKLDKNKLSEVLRWCYEIGIYAELEIIVGLPYENDEDFEDTCSFIEKNKRYISFIHPMKYYVIRDSLLGRFPEKYGIELFQEKTYESLLAWNKQLRINNFIFDQKDLGVNHFQILKFNEIRGRRHETIEEETHGKFVKMYNMMFEFPAYTMMYKMMNDIKTMVNN